MIIGKMEKMRSVVCVWGDGMSKKELDSDISKWEEKRYFSKTETPISNNINILFKDI